MHTCDCLRRAKQTGRRGQTLHLSLAGYRRLVVAALKAGSAPSRAGGREWKGQGNENNRLDPSDSETVGQQCCPGLPASDAQQQWRLRSQYCPYLSLSLSGFESYPSCASRQWYAMDAATCYWCKTTKLTLEVAQRTPLC